MGTQENPKTLAIERLGIKDKDWVKWLFEHPSIAPYFCTNGADLREFLVEALACERFYFLAPVVGVRRAGVIYFAPKRVGVYGCHVLILPEHRGERALVLGKMAMGWMLEHTNCRKLVAMVPVENRHAIQYGLRLGFKPVADIKKLEFEKEVI